MPSTQHVHGPDCQHEHGHHNEQPHVHGPHCNHGPQEPVTNPLKAIGRNDPCPCGSQKKYKKCHGA
ncbi:SEC-C metal-binding domain-containing protein [Denitrificimonas caeni]|uniref:SEC-C metal-binding domain-containing protein n=1 Tax=Denitrificimonas caeni TaxID=521720 RepID=A0AAF0AJD4_9GAMM|nr:SEC-C metal-binding domain-containing protein [Denitrificimonas caeni]WBE24191.1 SEC-C metal-binding domain-containing protein [Denitrificimonas caeni]